MSSATVAERAAFDFVAVAPCAPPGSSRLRRACRQATSTASWLQRDWPRCSQRAFENASMSIFDREWLGLPVITGTCLTTTNIIDWTHSGFPAAHTSRLRQLEALERWRCGSAEGLRGDGVELPTLHRLRASLDAEGTPGSRTTTTFADDAEELRLDLLVFTDVATLHFLLPVGHSRAVSSCERPPNRCGGGRG